MAGHNKWSKVKHIKARVDAIKGRVFSKCAHEIALAARAGGGDPAANARLRTAIDNAKAVSMPKDNIDRAIKKGTGELGGEAIQEVIYEGYGPAGVAFLVEIATDNLNRSAADMRSMFSKNGGSVATQGSVSYQFDRKGEIRIAADVIDEERLMEAAIEAGADDVQSDDESHVITTTFENLSPVSRALEERLGAAESVRAVWKPQTLTPVESDKAETLMKLIATIEDDDDVQNVYANYDIDDATMQALNAA